MIRQGGGKAAARIFGQQLFFEDWVGHPKEIDITIYSFGNGWGLIFQLAPKFHHKALRLRDNTDVFSAGTKKQVALDALSKKLILPLRMRGREWIAIGRIGFGFP